MSSALFNLMLPLLPYLLIIIELDKFIDVLDKRLEKGAKETPGLVAKKERKLGLPSSSIPPMEAPRWAVKCFDTQHSDAENEPEGELFSIYFS